jgi:phosphatidate cytidylyltransferase
MNAQNKNLLLRFVTAMVLLPLVIWLIVLGGLPFALLLSVAAALSALELNQMAASANPGGVAAAAPASSDATKTRSSRLGAGALASAIAAFLVPLLDQPAMQWLSLRMLLSALLLFAFIDALFFESEISRAPVRVGIALLAPLYTGMTLAALVHLSALEQGPWWIILALAVTWMNDTGGYFAGRAFGKHKLYPRISPSKTWEGAIGGAAASTAGALIIKFCFLTSIPLAGAALIGLGGSIIGPLGDLSESMLKRAFGAKDSGAMLPGHGGLLDRIDALLFVAPFVLFCAQHLISAR